MKLKSEVVSQLPETGCYICSRTKINKICHHCGQAICDKHRSSAIPKWFGIDNPEFADLKLDKLDMKTNIIHCQACVHYYIRLYKWMAWLGIATIAWGVIWMLYGMLFEVILVLIFGMMTFLVGIVLSLYFIQKHQEHYKQEIWDGRPPFPAIPTVKRVTITESLHGEITLNAEGKYKSEVEVEPSHGELALSVKFTDDDRERLEAYVKKYDLPKSENIPFHAGFVVLEGAPNLKFDRPDTLMPERVNTIALQGTIGEQPFLIRSEKEGGDSNWKSSFSYTILPHNGKRIRLPVQLIATLRKEGAGKGVEIVVQLSPKSSLVKSAHIDEFVLYAPHDLGDPIMQPTGFQATPESGLKITWKDIKLDSTAKGIPRESFYVRFQNKIEPSTILRGQLQMHFRDTLSRFNGVKLFYPWGRKRANRPKVTCKEQTDVVVDFELHMNKLRVQETMVKSESVNVRNMVPDHDIVINLTQGINHADIYVKRVIENQPRTSKVGAHITNRYWEIAGRQYDGVYPIDFHLVLTGEEVHTRINASKMQLDITVQALVTHNNDEMCEKVTSLLETLKAIIEETLDEQPIEVEISSEIEQPLPSIESATSEQIEIKIAHLLELLKKADEAFLEGRLSTERYDDMRHRLKKQLSEAGYNF